MNYIELVKNSPNKSESVMWKSVEHISNLIDQLEDRVPDLAREFIIREYETMYGGHFNESMARYEVSRMHHYDTDGTYVVGEVITPEEAINIAPENSRSIELWDAYVGANGFAHDLARIGISKDVLLYAAKEFWFHDDDFQEKSKIWWYYTSK